MFHLKTDLKLVQEKPADKPVAVFGLFKDLNSSFESEHYKSKYPQFSPIRGINKDFLKNLRLHGHYGPKKKGFPRPNWRGDTEKFPQDWTASLLEFFAPSYVGFLFDSHHTTPFHDWFEPANIALIFNTIIENSFSLYDWSGPLNTTLKTGTPSFEDSRDSVLKLAKCLQPKVNFQQLEIDEVKGRNFKQERPKYRTFSKIHCLSWPTKELPFTEILFNALNETKGDGAAKLGYPDHIVELILLTYMWERKKSKLDLKPFYDNLSQMIIDKSAINNIIWEGAGSFYTEEDYFKVVTKYNKNQYMTLEDRTLLQLGYPHFEDRYPPIQSYGVSFLKIDGKSISFSDCGENSLLNYFMIALYNFDTKRFDWEKLELLKKKGFNVCEKLIHFFRHIYVSPICDFTPEIRNAWAEVLTDLNAGSNIDLIEYLKNKCCIAPGLDNMVKVMKKLLQPPINYYDDVLLALLNLEEGIRWFKEKVEKDDKNITLTFSHWSNKHKKSNKIFLWHIQPIHFDFNRLEHAKYRSATQVLERLKAAINECSYRYPASDTFNIPEPLGIENEAAFSEAFFQGNLESIEGRCYALYQIFWFKNKFKSDCFDYLIQRWLEPTGKYFAGWEDFYTNKTLLKILMTDCKLSIETIDEMQIPALSAHMRAKIVYGVQVGETISSDSEDILIFGDVYGNVSSKNGRIKIIGNIGNNGIVNNIKGNIDINGDVCGYIRNWSGDNIIIGTVFKDGHVENSIGSNQIARDVYGHLVNTSGDNIVIGTVFKDGHVKNSTGGNEIGADVVGHIENCSGANKINGEVSKLAHIENATGKTAYGSQQTFFIKPLNTNETDLLIQHRQGNAVLQYEYDKRFGIIKL